ncbi:MAG TPA: hypothetical protein VF796_25155, partial [Humisphaera sp.]
RGRRYAAVGLMLAGLVGSYFARAGALALQTSAAESGPYAMRAGAGAGADRSAADAAPGYGSLDSYTLVLMLGGLRGPLVMYLWASSESQKNEKELEDFDTKVELIRLLQPEFDSVIVFQIWNKAYNISAQVPSLPQKYGIILDAVEYGRKADRGRPNNLNILMSLNQVFQHKLGTSESAAYYRRQMKEDSKARPPAPAAGVGALRRRMDPILNPDGTVIAALSTPADPRPANLRARLRFPGVTQVTRLPATRPGGPPLLLTETWLDRVKQVAAAAGVRIDPSQIATSADGRNVAIAFDHEADARKIEAALDPDAASPATPDQLANAWAYDLSFVYGDWNDGSELQYVARYGPYKTGVSPLAMGFNYAKRAQVLMTRSGQRPTQSSRAVIDSKPALELRAWGDEEFESGVIAEARAYKAGNRMDPWSGGRIDPEDGAEARDAYALAARLYRDARAEYARHLNRTDPTLGTIEEQPDAAGADQNRRLYSFDSQMDELKAREHLARADRDMTDAVLGFDRAVRDAAKAGAAAPSADAVRERDRLLRRARAQYGLAAYRAKYVQLRWYLPGEYLGIAFEPTGPNDEGIGDRPAVERTFFSPARVLLAHARMMALSHMKRAKDAFDQNAIDRQESDRVIGRAADRVRIINRILGEPNRTQVSPSPYTVDGTIEPVVGPDRIGPNPLDLGDVAPPPRPATGPAGPTP